MAKKKKGDDEEKWLAIAIERFHQNSIMRWYKAIINPASCVLFSVPLFVLQNFFFSFSNRKDVLFHLNSILVCGCALFLFFLSTDLFQAHTMFFFSCAWKILLRFLLLLKKKIKTTSFTSSEQFSSFFSIFSVYFQSVVHLYIFFQSNAFKHLALSALYTYRFANTTLI